MGNRTTKSSIIIIIIKKKEKLLFYLVNNMVIFGDKEELDAEFSLHVRYMLLMMADLKALWRNIGCLILRNSFDKERKIVKENFISKGEV